MSGLFNLILQLVDLYELLILVDCVMSWIPSTSSTVADIKDALRKLTDPFLNVIRNAIPAVSSNGLGIDFSPMVAIVVLNLAKQLLSRFLWVLF